MTIIPASLEISWHRGTLRESPPLEFPRNFVTSQLYFTLSPFFKYTSYVANELIERKKKKKFSPSIMILYDHNITPKAKVA